MAKIYRYGDSRQPWRVPLEILTDKDNVALTFILADGAVYKAIIFCINSPGRPICSNDATMNFQSRRSKAFSASRDRRQSGLFDLWAQCIKRLVFRILSRASLFGTNPTWSNSIKEGITVCRREANSLAYIFRSTFIKEMGLQLEH